MPDDPYRIATAEDLMLLGDSPEDYGKHFILTADIDLDPNLPGRKVFDTAVIAPDNDAASSYRFDGTPFTGVLDGNGHTILHLTISGESFLGLFGQLGDGAMISNLGLEGVDVNGSDESIGGLVGFNGGNITMSYTTGVLSGIDYVGGLAGFNRGTITTSYTAGTVIGTDWSIGGLVGYNQSGSITSSYSTTTVKGTGWNVGGLAGINGGSITSSYCTGTVTGDEHVGGLVGSGRADYVINCFWDMETSRQFVSDGGTGLTTVEMQKLGTFLEAGWDFIDEVFNGTCDYWQISAGNYPRLRYHAGDGPVMPEGLGTTKAPYLIRDVRDLGTVWLKPQAHYRLEASVDLSGIAWRMAVIPCFGGTFDGNGNVIRNLHIQGGGYLGLFGHLRSGAVISNVSVEAVDVNGAGWFVGGLVGKNYRGDIGASFSTGTVSGNGFVGGLVGYNDHGRITSSCNTGAVNGNMFIGGLAGSNWCGSIATSFNTGAISGDEEVGGLVGSNGGNIATSYSSALVSGRYRIGGLVGWNDYGSIISSYGTGTVIGTGENIGGLVGDNWHDSIIGASYSTAAVSGDKDVGGLVGDNSADVATSYSAGPVIGNSRVGGLVGYNEDGTVTTSFWDSETSGQATSAGGTGLTTAEMRTPSTFLNAGWDLVDETSNGTCDFWQVSRGDYPRLRYDVSYSPAMPEGLGTPERPYLIRNVRDLGTVWVKPRDHYRLEASVDLSGITWCMGVIPWFEGTFEGNSHVINSLHVQGGGYLGLLGWLRSEAEVSNLRVTNVNVVGSGDYVGGLAGSTSGIVAHCYSSGVVSGENRVGGLAGWNDFGSITSSSSDGTVIGSASSIGGLVGTNWFGNIAASRSSGTVTGISFVGGLLGANIDGIVTSSCSSSTVTGAGENIGGLVGNNWGDSITTSYSIGTVSGDKNVGGLVGNNWGLARITACYTTVAVTGNQRVGGLVGSNRGPITGSFWNIETSGQSTSGGGIGKTTAQMQTAATFLEAGWDFVGETANGMEDIWWILEGKDYPRLWWEARD